MGLKEGLWIVLFVLVWLPAGFMVGSTLTGASGTYTQDFSIYNTEWNGLSTYRSMVEENGNQVLAIQSSMSIVSRYNGSAVLVIMGPVRDFSADTVFSIFGHLSNGGSVLVADDFGTANSSFYWLNEYLFSMMGGAQLEQAGVDGFLSFTRGLLLDLDSHDTSPRFPIITDFVSHPVTNGVSDLHLNWASTLSPTCLLGSPLAAVAWSSTRSWCETNTSQPDPSPDPGEWAGRLPVAGVLEVPSLTGGRSGRLVAISDPSIFTNDMLEKFAGNQRFGMNILDWLSFSDAETPILFCEQLLAVSPNSAEFWFGQFLGRIMWMSAIPFIAPLYPIMTALGIKKYLPEIKKPEVKNVSEVFLRRGTTYFSERMTYYRTEGNYARVVKMIYRKMRRGLQTKHMWDQYDSKKMWALARDKDPRLTEDKFFKTVRRIEEISAKPGMKIRESEMMSLFFWMRDIEKLLIKT